MTARITPTPANPFGLTNTLMLDRMRALQQNRVIENARANQSGRNFGATVTGLAIGNALRNILVDKGWLEDPEADQAKQVSTAQTKARVATEADPFAKQADDPYAEQQAYGLNLVGELTRAGLTDQADLVRQKMLADEQQRLELQKLRGDIKSQTASTVGKEIDNRIDAATEQAQIQTRRAEAISASANANVAFGTQGYTIQTKQTERDNAIESLRHNRVNNPLVEARARDDATIAAIQSKVGGPVPELVRLQLARDAQMEAIANMAPGQDKRFAWQQVKEINEKIQTTALGIQRNVDNWAPTKQVVTDIQQGLVDAAGMANQAHSIVELIGKAPADSFGIDADTRVAIAGLGYKALTTFNFPTKLAQQFADAVVSDETLNARAQARQLKASIMTQLSSGSHATEADRKTADDILQVLDSDTVDSKQATVALTNFIEWVAQKQKTGYEVLQTNVKAVAPSAEQSLEEQFTSWQAGQPQVTQ